MIFFLKTSIAALTIAFCSWLASKKPNLAGFIIALPIASILALVFSYLEHRDASVSIDFAKSILVGVPASWLFFIPFFLEKKYNYGFWMSYVIGLLLLIVGYFIHREIMKFIN